MTGHRMKGLEAGRRVARAGVCAAAVLLPLAGGCAKQRATLPRPPEANPLPPVEQDVDRRVESLKRQSAELSRLAQNLPAANADENRRQLEQVFANLSQTLPTLAGPGASGVFSHQVTLVNDTCTQLAGSSADLATDPIVDRGLRAVYNALREAAQASYYQEPKVTQGLDALNARIEDLDAYPGAAHPSAVATAVQQTSDVVAAMTNALATRLSEIGTTFPAGPGTGPSTAPADGGK